MALQTSEFTPGSNVPKANDRIGETCAGGQNLSVGREREGQYIFVGRLSLPAFLPRTQINHAHSVILSGMRSDAQIARQRERGGDPWSGLGRGIACQFFPIRYAPKRDEIV